jgi:hypothetical protein
VQSLQAGLPQVTVGLEDGDISCTAVVQSLEFVYTDRVSRLPVTQSSLLALHADTLLTALGSQAASDAASDLGASKSHLLHCGVLPPSVMGGVACMAPSSMPVQLSDVEVEDAPYLAQLGSMHMQPRLLARSLSIMVAGYDLGDVSSVLGLMQFADMLGAAGSALWGICEHHLRHTVPLEDMQEGMQALHSQYHQSEDISITSPSIRDKVEFGRVESALQRALDELSC